jgi:hypothetical protein
MSVLQIAGRGGHGRRRGNFVQRLERRVGNIDNLAKDRIVPPERPQASQLCLVC